MSDHPEYRDALAMFGDEGLADLKAMGADAARFSMLPWWSAAEAQFIGMKLVAIMAGITRVRHIQAGWSAEESDAAAKVAAAVFLRSIADEIMLLGATDKAPKDANLQ